MHLGGEDGGTQDEFVAGGSSDRDPGAGISKLCYWSGCVASTDGKLVFSKVGAASIDGSAELSWLAWLGTNTPPRL